MTEKNTYEDIEKNTQEDDMFQGDLETLNVNVWFNKLESRLQNCLVKENVKDGFTQYKILVLHAEILAISSNKMNEEEYNDRVAKLLKDKIDKYDDEVIQGMKTSMIKYRVILESLLKIKKSDMNLTF